ncbi:branched-chain amino acid ABC transporter permease [Lacrimispora sp. NSJ-141]|uniref:Branched-chain amino acid ABC transporter permease n=2 Tax=Lachnospiraceae TaxID=186803 RepID=A0A7G9G119_9FIRM|nr:MULTISPECIES: branched-chain amino acid ABC transporter permease [Lachnospiraceae]MCD2493562.1 branched-chain amino acid ABC transporter permease [Lientehia hominis]QNM04501.1 branched-chain amino acid ABC transporter permease [Qiania dongpingensis]
MQYFISQIVNGLCQGSIYALMAIGYSVIVGVVGFVTFTHGEVIIMGAFAAYYAFEFVGSMNLPLGILAAFVASWLVGIFVYKVCYERFFKAPRHIALICTIAVSILLKNLMQIVFGAARKPMINVIDNKIYTMGPVQISRLQIVIILTVVVLSLLLLFIFKKTRWGVSLRAISQDKSAAALIGINVKRDAMVGNCIGSGLAGVAGLLIAMSYAILYPSMGSTFGMKAFTASVLGGLTSVPLAAVGGMCIGLVENIGITVTSATYRDIFAFVFLIIILLIRPQGFASKKGGRP